MKTPPVPSRVRIVMQGQFTKLEGVKMHRGNPDPPKRDVVSGFSVASRRRMIRQLAKMGKAVPTFVTVTYGRQWPKDPGVWKVHLDRFAKRLCRWSPGISAIWRLEPQLRGAPHYHFLVFREDGKAPFIPFEWVAQAWAECSDDTSAEHIAAGTRVERLRSHRGGMFYGAKYCAKVDEGKVPAYWKRAGRLWGIFGRKHLPEAPQCERVLHSDLEQRAALSALASLRESSILSSFERRIAEDQPEWSKLEVSHVAYLQLLSYREDNPHVFSATTFLGDAERFLSWMSRNLASLEFDEKLAIHLSSL